MNRCIMGICILMAGCATLHAADGKNKFGPLFLEAARIGNWGSVSSMLRSKLIDVNYRDAYGATAAYAAAFGNHQDVVRLLLEYKANPDDIQKGNSAGESLRINRH